MNECTRIRKREGRDPGGAWQEQLRPFYRVKNCAADTRARANVSAVTPRDRNRQR